MIKITLELISAIKPGYKKKLGEIIIANTGTGNDVYGNYEAKFFKVGSKSIIWKTANIFNFPRKRLGAYDLLLRALLKEVGKRNFIDADEILNNLENRD